MDNQSNPIKSDSNLQRLIAAATSYGYTDEQIIMFCDEIGRSAYEQFAQEVERLFSPEEKHDIENLSQEESDKEIKDLYLEKTGNDPQDVIDGYLARHVEEFIQDHKKESFSPVV